MIKIRRGVFETNSSSTHSMTMCSRKEYDEWRSGKRVYDYDKEELILIDALSDEEHDLIDVERYFTYNGYNDYVSPDYELFENSYMTETGEEVFAFGYYGYC